MCVKYIFPTMRVGLPATEQIVLAGDEEKAAKKPAAVQPSTKRNFMEAAGGLIGKATDIQVLKEQLKKLHTQDMTAQQQQHAKELAIQENELVLKCKKDLFQTKQICHQETVDTVTKMRQQPCNFCGRTVLYAMKRDGFVISAGGRTASGTIAGSILHQWNRVLLSSTTGPEARRMMVSPDSFVLE